MNRRLLALWLPLAALACWEFAARLAWINPFFFPAPSHLLVTAWRLVQSGELPKHVAATLFRLVTAFTAGSLCGIPCGLILGSLPFWRQSMQGVFTGLSATPKLSLLPAFLVLFGLNDGARLLPAALGCFVLTAVYSMDAARGVKQNYLDLAKCCGAGRKGLFFRVYLPACLPSLFTGMRMGMANVVVTVVAMELLAAPSGLGSFIWITSQTLSLDRMYVGIGTCTLIGVLKNYLFGLLERRATPWTIS